MSLQLLPSNYLLTNRLDAFNFQHLMSAEDLMHSTFRTPGTLLMIQCKASPPAHQCEARSSQSSWVSLGTPLIPLRAEPSTYHCCCT